MIVLKEVSHMVENKGAGEAVDALPDREPGDESEADTARKQNNKLRRQNGAPTVTMAEWREAKKAMGIITRFVMDRLKKREFQKHLNPLAALIQGVR